jgi:two-component system, sensor histidine kinase and response regulator
VAQRTVELGASLERLQESYDRLRELERLRDNLIHMIVHDLRTPLTAVKGFMELLELTSGDRLPEDGREYIRRAMTATGTLVEMVSSLLDVSRMESGQMHLNLTECDLAGLAADVTAKMDSLRRGRLLSLEAGTARITATCDRDLTARILQNLVGNALKFAPEDGRVRVRLEPGPDLVTVRVSDDGPGIPPEYHEKIFEKFGQVEARSHQQKHSTGLGLTFCKLAVEAHGGRIGVESRPGEGSTFWFTLPRYGPLGPAPEGPARERIPG